MDGDNHESEIPPPVFEHPNTHVRRELARQLHGHGVEFGPGCHPLPLGPFVESIRYCDAFTRDEFAAHFPEVEQETKGFPDPIDFVLDFDKEWFVDRVGEGTLDFVVANHVLEHLVNPIRFLEQCCKLLRDGGILFVGQPDKRRMFDRDRRRTPLADVVTRYENNEVVLSEARIIEYVNQVDQPETPFTKDSPGYAEEIERHRRRSLHVNIWLADDLIELFQHLGLRLGMPWELLDGVMTDEEFLLIFRKADNPDVIRRYPATLARLWHESQQFHLQRHYMPRLQELQQLCVTMHRQLMVMDERLRETQQFVQRMKQAARRLPGAKLAEKRLKRTH